MTMNYSHHIGWLVYNVCTIILKNCFPYILADKKKEKIISSIYIIIHQI